MTNVPERFSLLGIIGGLMMADHLGDVRDEINYLHDLVGLPRPEGGPDPVGWTNDDLRRVGLSVDESDESPPQSALVTEIVHDLEALHADGGEIDALSEKWLRRLSDKVVTGSAQVPAEPEVQNSPLPAASLTQRLVDAAGGAVFDEAKKWPTPPFSVTPVLVGATQQDMGRRAAAAVLRQIVAELREGFLDTDPSDYGKGWKDAYRQLCNDLGLWAGVIESGDAT